MLRDGRRFDFTIIENEIIDNVEKFDKNDVLCYMVLCRYANNDTGKCFPSYKTIAEKMRVSESTAIKAVKSLEGKGVLLIEKRKGESGGDTSNLYTITNINKEASVGGTTKATSTNKNTVTNNIPQSNKKYTSKNRQIEKGAGAKNINQRTDQYTEEELNKIIDNNNNMKIEGFKPKFAHHIEGGN